MLGPVGRSPVSSVVVRICTLPGPKARQDNGNGNDNDNGYE